MNATALGILSGIALIFNLFTKKITKVINMTALEAKKMAFQRRYPDVFSEIEKDASMGYFSCEIKIYSDCSSLIKILSDLGYKTEIINCYLNISWE